MPTAHVLLTDPHGLHARPAAMFAMMAAGFACDVTVSKDSTVVNGKSVLSLMGLGCQTGDEIAIITSGVDEDAALEKLQALLHEGSDAA